jgi:hypothetical protein
MAALCEGVPVVTSWHDVSDSIFLDRPFVKLLSTEETLFRQQLVALLCSTERPFQDVSGDEVRRFYRQEFSWSSIIRRYAEWSGLRSFGERVSLRMAHDFVSSPPSPRRESS